MRAKLSPRALAGLLLLVLSGGQGLALDAPGTPAGSAPQAVETGRDSSGCLGCHVGIERMHDLGRPRKTQLPADAAQRGMDGEGLTCVDCHGGNGAATAKEAAHVQPRHPKNWHPSGRNPEDSYAALNRESPEFVRFMNPSDFRIADQTCGRCHGPILSSMRKSVMSHNAMAHAAVVYNNGGFELKRAFFGEAYDSQGRPAELVSGPIEPGAAEHGALEKLVPHPQFPITTIKDALRVAEVHNPALGLRGPGTDGRIAGVFLNMLKTRLNDPTLWFLGPNKIAGDYRQSGCAACHVIYANDGDPWSSAHYAQYGNRGTSFTADQAMKPAQERGEPGHPIRHRLETSVPASQCLTCHYHQGDGALGTYLGRIWWDRETEAERVKQFCAEPEYGLTEEECQRRRGGSLPQADPYRKPAESDAKRYVQERLAEFNKEFRQIQFANFHAHGWNQTNVYKRDIRGRLLDETGKVIAEDDPLKWHKAVHLRDIHLEKGMQCLDCHTHQDMHGDGYIYPQMTDYIEIRCVDCHGTVERRASLKTSGHPWRPNDLRQARTPWADPDRPGERLPQFFERNGRVYQRSKMVQGLEWEVTQVADVVNPARPEYSPKAAYAKLVRRDGAVHFSGAADLAHDYDKMECTTCHSSWQTTCSGCHLPLDLNVKSKDKHYDDRFSRGYAPYYRQVVRTDLYFFGIGTTNHGSKLTPFRPASAVIVSAWDRNRNNVVHQQPLVSSPGFANEAMTPHPPHTVRKVETKQCSDCHVSEEGDNNARIASALGFGTNSLTFMGTYVYVAENGRGVTAVEVTEGREPMPVIGSNFHRILHPESYGRHLARGRQLKTAYNRRAPKVVSVATRGEYLLAAEGSAGLKLYDIANINNKAVAQRIVQAVNSPLGERTRVPMRNATFVHLPITLPVHVGDDDTRVSNRLASSAAIRRLNDEQPLADLYRYALVTDAEEGLILVDIDTLSDGDPQNNRLRRDVVFDDGGKLAGARMVKNWGHYAYVVSETNGLLVVDLKTPTAPRLVYQSPAGALDGARAVELQLHYAFVLDRQGFKVFDVTNPESPQPVPGATIPLADARGMTLARTYAFVAAGADGLVIIDIERPAQPFLFNYPKADVPLSDAYDVAVTTTNVSYFAYVADGKNGMAVVRLIEPPDTPGHMGYAPAPMPKLIAVYHTRGTAMAVSRGQVRDRYVDESGNQIAVTNRLGSRPLTRAEMDRFLFYPDGTPLRVRDDVPEELLHSHAAPGMRVERRKPSGEEHGAARPPAAQPAAPGGAPKR